MIEWIIAGGVGVIACQLAIIIGLLRKILAEAAKQEPRASLDRDIAEKGRREKARRDDALAALDNLDSQLAAIEERMQDDAHSAREYVLASSSAPAVRASEGVSSR